MDQQQNHVEARFEFRIFGTEAEIAETLTRLRQHEEQDREERTDIYLLAPGEAYHNVKLRAAEQLDIKRLVRRQDGLEQWKPVLKAPFPLFPELLRVELYQAWDVVPPLLTRQSYSVRELIEELVMPSQAVVALAIHKQSQNYTVGDVSAEYSQLEINGACISTIALEDGDPQLLQQARQALGLDEQENVSYPLALKRLCGFEISPYLQQWL